MTLTITIERRTPENPNGYIGMTAQKQAPGEDHPRFEDAADGMHSESTLVKVFDAGDS